MTDERYPDVDSTAAHLRPAQRGDSRRGGEQGAGSTASVPWEDPRRDGRAAAFIATWWQLVRSPLAAFAAIPAVGGTRRPVTFALLCGAVFGIASELIDSTTVALLRYGGAEGSLAQWIQLDIAGRSLEWLPISILSAAGCLLALAVGAPLYMLLYTLLLLAWIAVLHTALGLTGALAVSNAGYRGTLRAVAYSQVAMVGAIVPWIGDPLAILWSLGLQVLGLARLHRCTRARAALAVALPAAVLILLVVVAILRAAPDAAG